MEKKLDGNNKRMLWAVLKNSGRQPDKTAAVQPITKTIQMRPTRHAWYCWRNKDELTRDVHLWTPSHGRASVGRPARTYLSTLEDLPGAMDDRDGWEARVREISASSTRWWWWWFGRLQKYCCRSIEIM